MDGNWIFEEERGPVYGRAEFGLRESGDGIGSGECRAQWCAPGRFERKVGRGGSVMDSTLWYELKSDKFMKTLFYFVGEGGWWSTKRNNKRLILEEDDNVTETFIRINFLWAPK